MRFAVLADIHGNALALEAVLEDLDRLRIDQAVNLGDVLSGPLDPRGVAERIIPLGWPTVRGNHDRHLIEQDPTVMGASDAVTYQALEPGHFDWLRGLPETLMPFEGVFACHATPGADDIYWMERVQQDGLTRAATQTEMASALNEKARRASLALCGHSHTVRMAQLADGPLLVNPGSVGCPAYTDADPVPHCVQNGTPHANYAVIEKHAAGWDVTFRSVHYDHRAAAAQARAYGREDWAKGLESGWL